MEHSITNLAGCLSERRMIPGLVSRGIRDMCDQQCEPRVESNFRGRDEVAYAN